MIADYRQTPEKVPAKDEHRIILTYLWLDVERKRLEATDSYCLVSLPVEVEEDDVTGYVTVDALKAARKASKLRHNGGGVSLRCNDGLHPGDGSILPRPSREIGQFVNVPQLVDNGCEYPEQPTISLNVKLLANLAAALGSDTVSLYVAADAGTPDNPRPGYLRPIKVAAGTSDGEALMWPIKVVESTPNGDALLMPIKP